MTGSKFERHFFVCQQQRPPQAKPSCGARGSGEIYERLQEGLAAHPEIWSTVQLTACGCLGNCFDGPSMVVYPDGVWYGKVAPGDVGEIVESHMVGGRPVQRLLYQWPPE